MFSKALQQLEKTIRNYGSLQFRIKEIEDIAYALGKNGVPIDEALISTTLKKAEMDIKNLGKYLECFKNAFNDGWQIYTQEMMDKFQDGYSPDIPR
jgi:hypothetical protein